jgi:uncharacterized protein
MQRRHHLLSHGTPGSARELVSFHYGDLGHARRVYVQASLHADELPGMLVAHHLRQRLLALEDDGALRCEVVVVPVANPIGLAQSLLRVPHGRFELQSGENFNRHYSALFAPVLRRVEGKLGADAPANASLIRAALREAVAESEAATELASLRKTLLGLACDAELVLDLHCDGESVLHLYTGTPVWDEVEPLARYLGAQATLLAKESGDNPFDEACSQSWWQLAEHFGESASVPMGCIAVTVELRGEVEVSHALAERDADALVAYLRHRGLIDGDPAPLPPLLQPATPLAGSEAVKTPVAGVLVFLRSPGEIVAAGDVLAEVIDPLSGAATPLRSATDGLLYARDRRRFVPASASICKVAGQQAFRSGKLLSE